MGKYQTQTLTNTQPVTIKDEAGNPQGKPAFFCCQPTHTTRQRNNAHGNLNTLFYICIYGNTDICPRLRHSNNY